MYGVFLKTPPPRSDLRFRVKCGVRGIQDLRFRLEAFGALCLGSVAHAQIGS